MGDLNFRVDRFTRSEVEKLVKDKEYDKLLREDQVRCGRYLS